MPPGDLSTLHSGRVEVEFSVQDSLDQASATQAGWSDERLRRLVRGIVEQELPPGSYQLSLHLVDDVTIRELNLEHRGQDAHTDVLSFPLHDPHGMRFVVPANHPIHLGDVVVSLPRTLAQAEAFGHTPERELAYLVAHGALHVLGYDHQDEAERLRMRAREEEALQPLGFTR